jgi:hypothetical protein
VIQYLVSWIWVSLLTFHTFFGVGILVICFKSKAFLPQGSHTPDEVFLILCRVFSFSGVFARAPSDLDRLSFLTLQVLLLCIGILVAFFFFSLKSPGPFFGFNRSESQDSLAVILTALPPSSTFLVTLRFICSCPNFSAVAFKQPHFCVILPLNNSSSFLMLFFIHCSAPVSVLLPLLLFVFLR